jgi:transposase
VSPVPPSRKVIRTSRSPIPSAISSRMSSSRHSSRSGGSRRSPRGGSPSPPSCSSLKYLLRLDLTDAGFDASVLCEFRGRLVAGEAEDLLLDTLLTWCRERGLLKARGKQRTDPTHVLAAVRALNRLELVSEAMRHALDSLAVAHPVWLRASARAEWAERYERRAEDARLPKSKEGREGRALAVGCDGVALLATIRGGHAPPWLRELPAVETLRRVWVQN